MDSEAPSVKSKGLIPSSFPGLRASVSTLPGSNGQEQLIEAREGTSTGMPIGSACSVFYLQLGWSDDGMLLGFWGRGVLNEDKGTHVVLESRLAKLEGWDK